MQSIETLIYLWQPTPTFHPADSKFSCAYLVMISDIVYCWQYSWTAESYKAGEMICVEKAFTTGGYHKVMLQPGNEGKIARSLTNTVDCKRSYLNHSSTFKHSSELTRIVVGAGAEALAVRLAVECCHRVRPSASGTQYAAVELQSRCETCFRLAILMLFDSKRERNAHCSMNSAKASRALLGSASNDHRGEHNPPPFVPLRTPAARSKSSS